MIAERTRADSTLTTSQRWALTGNSGASTQAPLGRRRRRAPPELEGVRSAGRRRRREAGAGAGALKRQSVTPAKAGVQRHGRQRLDPGLRRVTQEGDQAAVSSRRSPARFISAFCSFSNARTSIWRMRSRLTS